MRKSSLWAVAAVLFLIPPARASLSRQIVHYDIQARLVPETKTIQGREILTWLNDADVPVSELRVHLYLNAFKNNRSTFMKESGVRRRGFKPDGESWGSIDVTRIQVKDGTDLTPTLEFVQPDDRNPDDQTVARVSLPAAVKPKESVALVIDFNAKLPRVIARSGFSGDFFMVGQWFPKIGVWWKGQWNCHQYHASSEFFADFGTFAVEITVPERFVVGAMGRRTAERKNPDGTRTLTYVQEDVHDFAWAACPEFVEYRERFTLADPAVDTEMIVLVHRAHLNSKDRYVRSLRQGLEFYSRHYGPYPYGTITLVDPAPGAAAAGGMEYPTLFTAATTSYMPAGVRLPEMVTIHEFGHSYWYGIVATNEFEEAWLDEGINSYSEAKAMAQYYGPEGSLIDFGPLRVSDIQYQRYAVIDSGRADPILRNSWEYLNGGSYGLNVYSKASLMLLTLERLLGEETMAKVMKTYYERWKFRHPTSADFVQAAEDASGRDLKWFFDQALNSPDKLDYAVGSLASDEVAPAAGIFNGKLVAPPETKGKNGKAVMYRNEVVIVRNGEWIVPQDVLIVLEGGQTIRETWDGRERWKKFVLFGPRRLDYAQVDPDNRWLLDADFSNNSMRLQPRPGGPRKIALKITDWFQHLLSLAAF
ncbi:MAG: M1 family metallopeptidase [Candidatus Aminicenantales bacterium]